MITSQANDDPTDSKLASKIYLSIFLKRIWNCEVSVSQITMLQSEFLHKKLVSAMSLTLFQVTETLVRGSKQLTHI